MRLMVSLKRSRVASRFDVLECFAEALEDGVDLLDGHIRVQGRLRELLDALTSGPGTAGPAAASVCHVGYLTIDRRTRGAVNRARNRRGGLGV
jgi:hypothetical protein